MRAKGCFNENCSACRNDIKYIETYQHCPKCGCKLEYVCLRCHTQLDKDSKDPFCNKHAVQKDAIVKKVKDYSTITLNELERVGAIVITYAKNFVNNINTDNK